MTADEKALIALLVAAFLLSSKEIAAMATLISVARIDSAKASYAAASDTAGVSGEDWEPDKEFQDMANEVSEKDAQSISDTYKADLESVAAAFVAGWLLDHETLDGCEAKARESLSIWTKQRAEWKSEQIAKWTCGSGASDGTDLWLGDLIDGEFDLPEGLSADDVEVTVLPETATCSRCLEYAGESFDIDEIDDIPEFPLHTGCDHRKVVQMK